MQTTKTHRTRRTLAGAALALTALLAAIAGPASADTLYAGGAWVDATAHCDRDYHTMELRLTAAKDPRYAWQKVQYMYRVTDNRTGGSFATQVQEVVVSDALGYSNFAPFRVPSTEWRLDYAVRLGLPGGWTGWSTWTHVNTFSSWGNQGWAHRATYLCYS